MTERSSTTAAATRAPRKTGRRCWIVVGTVLVLLALAATAAMIAWPVLRRDVWLFVNDYRYWGAVLLLAVAIGFVLSLMVAILRSPWGSPWREHVLASADSLCHQLKALPAPPHKSADQALRDAVTKAVDLHLGKAREAAEFKKVSRDGVPKSEAPRRLPLRHQFVDWWTGPTVRLPTSTFTRRKLRWLAFFPTTKFGPVSPKHSPG
jgi:hypothetical protein